jgi:ribosomal-protein-alanine N-acetyltransferase
VNQKIPDMISIAKVRKAVVEDIPAMMRMASAAPTASQWTEARHFDLFAPGSPERIMLVIEEDSDITGFLVARGLGEECEIENIVVSVDHQRRGLATKLLKYFMRLADEANVTKVFLEVRQSNAAARALYAKQGFTEIGERKNYYRSPEESGVNYQLLIR